MQFQVRESDDSCQPVPQYPNPPVVVQEHHGAPLLNCSGLVLMRQLMARLGVARAIDAGVRVLRRCKWYRESDHILTVVYSMVSERSKLQDVNRLVQDDALKRVLGSDRIPHATTIGKFLWRFALITLWMAGCWSAINPIHATSTLSSVGYPRTRHRRPCYRWARSRCGCC